MTRLITLVGYGLVALCAVGLELAARRFARLATFAETLAFALRLWPFRLVVLTGWLWLGWHIFVRVDWH